MNLSDQSTSYFDAYWRARYDPVLFERRISTLHKNYADHLPAARDARIVEIGPGFGEMQHYLARRGYDKLTSVDIDGSLVRALVQRGVQGALHVEDTTSFLRENPGEFNCLIALHVLEHFTPETGQALLCAAHDCLAPGGRIILEVPNMANFITGPYARWADFTHRQGFTAESLQAAVMAAGFEVKACFGANRAITSLAQLLGHAAQRCTDALAWSLLKVNFPRQRLVTCPVIAVVASVSPRRQLK